jgi:hypothetical protein
LEFYLFKTGKQLGTPPYIYIYVCMYVCIYIYIYISKLHTVMTLRRVILKLHAVVIIEVVSKLNFNFQKRWGLNYKYCPVHSNPFMPV